MNLEPPPGSIIQIERDIHSTTYFWENGKKGFKNIPAAAFLLFWLCGWTFGGFMAMKELLESDAPLFGRLFLLFWLCGWLVGEVAVIFILYNMFRALKPAVLILSRGFFEYHTGTKPYDSYKYEEHDHLMKKQKFIDRYKNKVYIVESNELDNLRLDYVGNRQRLSFDKGIERIEIGEVLSEPEREWLYNIIVNHISR